MRSWSQCTDPPPDFFLFLFLFAWSRSELPPLSRVGVLLFWGPRTLDGIWLSIFRLMAERPPTLCKHVDMITSYLRGVMCWRPRPCQTITFISRHRPCSTCGPGRRTYSRRYGRTRIALSSSHQPSLRDRHTRPNTGLSRESAWPQWNLPSPPIRTHSFLWRACDVSCQ